MLALPVLDGLCLGHDLLDGVRVDLLRSGAHLSGDESLHDCLFLDLGTLAFVHTHDVSKDASTLLVNDVEASHEKFKFEALRVSGIAFDAKLASGAGQGHNFVVHSGSIVY